MLSSLDQIDVLVVRSQDRLSRDLGIWTMVSTALRTAGVRVETFTGTIDNWKYAAREFFADMMAVVGKLEKRQTGQRVKQAMGARARLDSCRAARLPTAIASTTSGSCRFRAGRGRAPHLRRLRRRRRTARHRPHAERRGAFGRRPARRGIRAGCPRCWRNRYTPADCATGRWPSTRRSSTTSFGNASRRSAPCGTAERDGRLMEVICSSGAPSGACAALRCSPAACCGVERERYVCSGRIGWTLARVRSHRFGVSASTSPSCGHCSTGTWT